jgi:hypothetical protein
MPPSSAGFMFGELNNPEGRDMFLRNVSHSELQSIVTQKTTPFIIIAVKISDPRYYHISHRYPSTVSFNRRVHV